MIFFFRGTSIQNNGLVLLYDLHGAAYKSCDVMLCVKILTFLQVKFSPRNKIIRAASNIHRFSNVLFISSACLFNSEINIKHKHKEHTLTQ